jgi:pimeloyl-ACP methyl ester carboxylesterase
LGLFDALQLERAHVVGLSFGSTIAQHFAADYPDRVNALVLYNTWGRTDEYLRRMFEIWRYFTATAEPLDYGRFILWWILSAGFINENPQVVDGIAAESFAGPGAAPRETHLQQLDINMTHDASGKLGTIRAPTLVLAGEVDRTVPSSYAEAVGKSIPSAITHILTGPTSSHGMVIEAGGEVNEHTISFLQAVDEGAPSRSR